MAVKVDCLVIWNMDKICNLTLIIRMTNLQPSETKTIKILLWATSVQRGSKQLCHLMCKFCHFLNSPRSTSQYMLLTHADDLLCLQLLTVWSPHTVRASNPCWWLAVPTAAHSAVSTHSTHASNPCRCLAVPTAAHSMVSTHSTCF